MSTAETSTALRILVIDDEPAVLRTVADYLESRGHHVHTSETGKEGILVLEQEIIDIVITDVRMPGIDGFQVMKEVKRRSPDTEVILITAFGDVEGAVRAMREGAFDFFTKPVKMRDLAAALRRTVRFQELKRENIQYRNRLNRIEADVKQQYGLGAIIGDSPGIEQARNLVREVCNTDTTTVMICGETGTGKELFARAIHLGSSRSEGPFVAVNCSAIPQTLMESEFFGHEKGAFTDARRTRIGHFEAADRGTLFLDEIGDMHPHMQTQLLRALEERQVRRLGGNRDIPVDVRIVSATNLDLPGKISEGSFREDLFYRLNTFTINIPPLRERPEDVLLLANHFLILYSTEMRKAVNGYTPAATDLLLKHSYQGNIRELRNIVERAVILCKGELVNPDHLDFRETSEVVSRTVTDNLPFREAAVSENLDMTDVTDLDLSNLERAAVEEALRRCEGNQVHAAKLLGVSRYLLRRRMAQYGILSRAK